MKASMTIAVLVLMAGIGCRALAEDTPRAAPAPAAPIGGVPGPTLADDLKTTDVPLVPAYSTKHPRLLFGPEDRQALKKKAEAQPKLWAAVLASSKRLASDVPTAETIKIGKSYWRIERVESGALAYFVTGDKSHLDRAVPWMLVHCREPVWGEGLRGPSTDLFAGWYLYHIAIAYDILHSDLTEADRQAIRDGLASHAKMIYDSFDPNDKEPCRYDQNHTYIPAVALATASLVLLEEAPEAKDWLRRAYAVMRRSRYVLSEDGYYYEGYGYWIYALHWHVRYADVMSRATGQKWLDLPALRENWRFALYLGLPGAPYAFDMNDSHTARESVSVSNYGMLWDEASAFKCGEARTAADLFNAREPDNDYPAANFLWFDPAIEPVPLEKIKPYYHFKDHDVVSWRSGWDQGATCYAFRCGPPLGHKALAKTTQLKDWLMNCGHVHADIGSFWMYAKGVYLATDTGYTAEKWTRDQNALLVDGKGQAMDGSYWNDRGFPYEKLNQARIDRVRLSDDHGYVSGEFGSVYDRVAPGLKLRRTLLMTQRWLLVVDEMSADAEHKLTWLCHADAAEFKQEGPALVARSAKAALAALPLGVVATDPKMESATVVAGTGPGQGKPTQRGFQLSLTMARPARSARLVNLLVPLGPDEKPPQVQPGALQADSIWFGLVWPDGRTENVTLNVDGRTASASGGPAVIVVGSGGSK